MKLVCIAGYCLKVTLALPDLVIRTSHGSSLQAQVVQPFLSTWWPNSQYMFAIQFMTGHPATTRGFSNSLAARVIQQLGQPGSYNNWVNQGHTTTGSLTTLTTDVTPNCDGPGWLACNEYHYISVMNIV